MKKRHIFVMLFYAMMIVSCIVLKSKETKKAVYKLPDVSTSDSVPVHKVQVTSGDIIEFPSDVESAAASSPESAGESPEDDASSAGKPKVILFAEMPNTINANPKPENKGLTVVNVKNTKVVNAASNLVEGKVVYQIPEKMKIRTTYQVLLRISKSKKTVTIYEDLTGTVRASEIPVTQTMEVKLVDPSPDDDKYFEIVGDNEAIQLVDSGETYTQWTWDVTPIRVGNSPLKIVVSIIRDGNKKDVVYQDTVMVEKDVKTQVLFFIKKYWQWIVGTLLLPFIGFLYKRRKERAEAEAKRAENP